MKAKPGVSPNLWQAVALAMLMVAPFWVAVFFGVRAWF